MQGTVYLDKSKLSSSDFDSKGLMWRSSLAYYLPRSLADKVRRSGIDRLDPSPLDPGKRVEIEVMVPCGEGDKEIVSDVLSSALANVIDPIKRVTVVSQTGDLPISLDAECPVRQLSDADVLGNRMLEECRSLSQKWEERIPTGWFIQQLLKFQFARHSDLQGVLILDADTLLTGKRQFLDETGVQTLIPSYELHKPYDRHYLKFFAQQERFCLSFVTHHQLMQPDIVRRMFPDSDSLLDWLAAGDKNSPSSPVSEYHSYGRFAIDFFPERVRLASFKYRTLARGKSRSHLLNSAWMVTSMHNYLRA